MKAAFSRLTTSAACAEFLRLKLIGEDVPIVRVANFGAAETQAVKFFSAFKDDYLDVINAQPDNFFIVTAEYSGKLLSPHVISSNPRLDFCLLANQFFPVTKESKIESSAAIADDVVIGDGVYIGHNVVVESGVRIGNNTCILHNVVISQNCQIGSNCLIKSGSVIGQRGFGFSRDFEGIPHSFPHRGAVIIGNHVEIGALNTIVAGALSDTVIGDHVKMDDHVHIAHNAEVGFACFITACAEVSGSVRIGEQAWLGPNCTVIDKVTIGRGSFVGIGSVVIKDVADSAIVVGNPARVLRTQSGDG